MTDDYIHVRDVPESEWQQHMLNKKPPSEQEQKQRVQTHRKVQGYTD